MSEAYALAHERLEDPTVPADAAPELIVFMAQLSVVEKLPGTRDEDPMQLYLGTMDAHFVKCMQVCAGKRTLPWACRCAPFLQF